MHAAPSVPAPWRSPALASASVVLPNPTHNGGDIPPATSHGAQGTMMGDLLSKAMSQRPPTHPLAGRMAPRAPCQRCRRPWASLLVASRALPPAGGAARPQHRHTSAPGGPLPGCECTHLAQCQQELSPGHDSRFCLKPRWMSPAMFPASLSLVPHDKASLASSPAYRGRRVLL